MKKIIAILLVTIMIGGLVLAAGNGAAAGGGNGQGNGNGDQQQQQVQEFVDTDGDGVCDNAGTGNGPGDGDGNCDETPEAPQDGTGNQYGRNKLKTFNKINRTPIQLKGRMGIFHSKKETDPKAGGFLYIVFSLSADCVKEIIFVSL